VVTPLVQQQAVHLSPVLLILAQMFMYYWAGALGMLLAPALAVVVTTLVEMLYVQDILGKEPVPD
jgi:predicted PurR-regulated permease PerM